jgi:heat shock protein HslJ
MGMPRILILALALATVAVFAMVAGPGIARAQTFSSATWELARLPSVSTSDDFEAGKLLSDSDSSRYTIEFLSDGMVSVQVDCNDAAGHWTDDGEFDITITDSTFRSCSNDLIGDDFLDQLNDVDGYSLSDDDEELTLYGPAGDMLFETDS